MKKIIVLMLSLLSISGYIPEKVKEPIDWQTIASGNRLDEELSVLVRLKEYQAKRDGKGWKYFCNIAARDLMSNQENEKYRGWFGNFLSFYGYDLSPIFPTFKSQLSTTIDSAYYKTLKAIKRGEVISHTPAGAQARANVGVFIWIIAPSWLFTHGHEAIVCPDEGPYNYDWGPYIAQCGKYCCKAHARDSRVFGERYKDKRILYIEFKKGEA